MMTNNETASPHPGFYLREELDERGWTQRDLAYVLGCPDQAVHLIISGKRAITPDTAKALALALDVSPELLLNLQKSHDLSRAREPSDAIARRARLQQAYPIREMIKRGWLSDPSSIDELEIMVAAFFGAANVNDVPNIEHAARKTSYAEVTPIQMVWLHRVRQLAAALPTRRYSEAALRVAIDDLENLLLAAEEARHVPRILAECGVRFVVVEQLPGSKIDGACFWLNDGATPVVGMSLRFDRIDNFWFVLRHELEHVLRRHGVASYLVDENLEGGEEAAHDALPDEEKMANRAAANFCAPHEEFEDFVVRYHPLFSEEIITEFSSQVNRHPGLIVGQLHRRFGRHNFLRRHLSHVREIVVRSALTDGWGQIAPVTI